MEYKPPSHHDSLTLPSGRVLAWTIFGGPLYAADAAANPAVIFYFHGFPGSRCEAGFLSPALLQQHHARCIAIDRPGMGDSGHDPNRRILDWPADVLAVADHLGVEEFYIVAVSGGGPYGLACAKEIPHVGDAAGNASEQPAPARPGRLRGVAIICGAYPTTLGMHDMLPGPRTLITAGAWLPRMATGALLDWQMGGAARNQDPTALEAMLDREMAQRPEYERGAYQDEHVRRTVIESLRESFRQGGEGVATDLMLVADWGFELQDVNARGVRLWHGKLDRNVPFAMAEKAAQLLPDAEVHFIENEGHLGLPVRHLEEIFADLLRDWEA
jgi:pimeloyl-ACP methyl ester carboxylesterase